MMIGTAVNWFLERTPEQVLGFFYVIAIIWAVGCLGWGHRKGRINLWDVLTATDRTGVPRTDGRKLYEAGAFVVMTATFVFLSLLGKMTEWYALIFVGAWVGARIARDQAQIKADAQETRAVLSVDQVQKGGTQ